LLHDCNPPTEEVQVRDPGRAEGDKWNGDVWKAVAYVRRFEPGLFCRVIDLDQGVGVIIPRDYDRLPQLTEEVEKKAQEYFDGLSWTDLEQERGSLLGLIRGREDLLKEMACEGLTVRFRRRSPVQLPT
jgi:hypothetical protein